MIHMTITMRSVALDMDTKVDVLLPEDRHHTEDLRGKKYPVLYVLHGTKEDNSSWLHLSNLFLLARDLDLIIVFPSAGISSYVDEYYGQDYYTYISQELPVKLKNFLPISDRREDTFIMGESMGGYGTWRIALANPDKYGKAIVFSHGDRSRHGGRYTHGATIPKMRMALYGPEEHNLASDNNLDNLVEKLKTYEGPKPEIYVYCGTEDHLYEVCRSFYEHIKAECPDMKIEGEFTPGKHNFFYWNSKLPSALHHLGFEIEENSVV